MEMQERKEPKFIQFSPGDVVEGVLVAIDKPEVNGKPTARFVVATGSVVGDEFRPDGERECFLGTYQLCSKLRPHDIGHFIEVRYEGENKSITRGGNPLREFKVRVSAQPVSGSKASGKAVDLGITDDDIPF